MESATPAPQSFGWHDFDVCQRPCQVRQELVLPIGHHEGVHVNESWHQFAILSFSMRVDQPFAAACATAAGRTGFQARAIDYQNFPIDTGTIVADSLLNNDHLPMSAISC